MSRVEELQRTLQELTTDEFAEIASYVRALEQEHWGRQLDRDAAAGSLDFLVDEAQEEQRTGFLKNWPPQHEVSRDHAFLAIIYELPDEAQQSV